MAATKLSQVGPQLEQPSNAQEARTEPASLLDDTKRVHDWGKMESNFARDMGKLGKEGLLIDKSKKMLKDPPPCVINVFQTFMVKSLTEDSDGQVWVTGTIIQRTLGVDLK